jgi:hypothetical protein
MEAEETEEEEEEYEIVTSEEVEAVKGGAEDRRVEEALRRLEGEVGEALVAQGLGEEELRQIVQELRHLEEKLHLWREVEPRLQV